MQYFHQEGLQLLEQGHALEAVEAFTAAIDMMPDTISFCYRGLCYFEVNEFDRALADYIKAIELDDESVPEASYFRGMLHGQMGNHGEAIADLSKAIESKGQVRIAEAYYHRAAVFGEVGEHDMGIDDMTISARDYDLRLLRRSCYRRD